MLASCVGYDPAQGAHSVCLLGPHWAVDLAQQGELVLVRCTLIYTDLLKKGTCLSQGTISQCSENVSWLWRSRSRQNLSGLD